MATYDQDGNTVYPTDDPNVVKEHLRPGQSAPLYSTLVPDGAGGNWAYYPTQTALMLGKVMAAVDTVAALPDQLAEQGRAALNQLPNYVLYGIIAFVAYEVLLRRAGR